MNQILATKPTKKRKQKKQGNSGNIKGVISFFAISIIIFGICLISSGSYAVYKSLSSNNKSNSSRSISNTKEQTDSKEIRINLSVEGENLNAKINGEQKISFVTYKWDDEEETRENIDDIYGEVEIKIPSGKHTLTITAVDVNNNSETTTKQVTGVTKPKLQVSKENNVIVIEAEDKIGIEKIEFIINDQGYRVNVEGKTEKVFKYKLPEGDKTVEVTVYNTEGVTETFKATW